MVIGVRNSSAVDRAGKAERRGMQGLSALKNAIGQCDRCMFWGRRGEADFAEGVVSSRAGV